MKGAMLSAAMAAMILAFSPVQAGAAARVQESGPQSTADLNRQSLQTAQTGKSAETTGPTQSKSAEANSARAKTLRRNYAIRARIAKQKTQLAKAKKTKLKGKKQLAKPEKRSLKTKKQAV